MILVGLTGGVAGGKSTVAKMFKRCGATVIWATFEMAKEGPRYRVGLDFVNPNVAALDAYIGRHKRGET